MSHLQSLPQPEIIMQIKKINTKYSFINILSTDLDINLLKISELRLLSSQIRTAIPGCMTDAKKETKCRT